MRGQSPARDIQLICPSYASFLHSMFAFFKHESGSVAEQNQSAARYSAHDMVLHCRPASFLPCVTRMQKHSVACAANPMRNHGQFHVIRHQGCQMFSGVDGQLRMRRSFISKGLVLVRMLRRVAQLLQNAPVRKYCHTAPAHHHWGCSSVRMNRLLQSAFCCMLCSVCHSRFSPLRALRPNWRSSQGMGNGSNCSIALLSKHHLAHTSAPSTLSRSAASNRRPVRF